MNQDTIKGQLPEHLRQFVADQNYRERYTAKDQAVWRLVLKLLVRQLKDTAHPVYFEGLKQTGIDLTQIPTIDEMNICLARLGWRAIVVDGFIPPQAFMELQSLKVLAIALDMRKAEHILYTPAPDIIHEAAGHAPIIADVEYAEYLQRFGEVGMRALYNQYDIDLYESVRELSIVKEAFADESKEVREAQAKLTGLIENPGEPSELALLTRLHWWTVEYGLVGDVTNYKIFGAGLLSSLSESRSCLNDDEVKKLPLTVDAIQQAYDITQEQPQLFVTKSCRHLSQVLEEFADTMCFNQGGTRSLEIAAGTGVVTTAELSSGVQVSGKFLPPLKNALDEAIYIRTEGPTQLSFNRQQLHNHGTDYHAEGFGSPLGRLCNLMKPLETASEYELQEMGIFRDAAIHLEFISGVTVTGHLEDILKDHATVLVLKINSCTVLGPNHETLFDPGWGTYDMVVGDKVTSVYAGSGDPRNFDVYPAASGIKHSPPHQARQDEAPYVALQEATSDEAVLKILKTYPNDYLLHIEAMNQISKDRDVQETVLMRLKNIENQPEIIKTLY